MPKALNLSKLLTMTPEEIQSALDQALADAPAAVKAVIFKVDYVEPGSVRSPDCKHYLKLGEYEGAREVIEIAIQVRPGAPELAVAMALRLL